jgi:protein-S-isoprenylcysteine O-methyltransferase Ste14
LAITARGNLLKAFGQLTRIQFVKTAPAEELRLMMQWDWLTREIALDWAGRLWELLMLVWLVLFFGMKRAKKREQWNERAPYLILLLMAAWLLYGPRKPFEWLNYRVLPDERLTWGIGLAVTAVGIGIAIWARLSLGANWSGTVTLKDQHELVRTGLYRWIRHPIYTGILLAMFGTAAIKGYLGGFLGAGLALLAFYIKARREESFLREEFGAGFEEHARHTGMFLPKLT